MLTAGQLLAQLQDAITSGHADMPVVVTYDEGDETHSMDVVAGTKKGDSFQIFPDTESVRIYR